MKDALRRSVCIVGFAPQTRALANAEPPEVELWGMNINHIFLTRWDRWFQVHPFVWEGKPFYGRDAAHLDFLASCRKPVYMTDPHESITTAVQYPLNRVVENIGRDYLTSTAAYALALAITEGVDEIKLYGVHGATELEYIQQRPCIEWLLGLAQGRGIKAVVPDISPILHGERYPGSRLMDGAQAQERLDFNRVAYMDAWAKAAEYLGAYRALKKVAIELPPGAGGVGLDVAEGVRKQYLEQVMRAQRDLGKYKEALLTVHKLGNPDTGSTKLPDLDIPAKLLSVEDVAVAAR